MTPKRVALGFLAIISGLGCLYVATTDVHYRDRNCGKPIDFRTHPNGRRHPVHLPRECPSPSPDVKPADGARQN